MEKTYWMLLFGVVVAACSSDGGSDTGSDGGQDASVQIPSNHRAEAVACDGERPATDWAEQIAIDTGHGWGPINCTQDSDCTSEPDGRCARLGDGYYDCTYHACSSDEDCADNGVCACGIGPVEANVCLKAHCRVDADCGAAGWCAGNPVQCQPGFLSEDIEFRCVTDQDECVDDADCLPCPLAESACQHAGWCGWDEDKNHRVCSYAMCVN